MQFNSDITTFDDGAEVVRGHALQDLVQQNSFVDTIFLLLQKRLPKETERRMLDAMLTTVIDHGPDVASAMNARISASAVNGMHTSLAAGILGFGERHGMAASGMMYFLEHQKENSQKPLRETLIEMKQEKQRVPGFGHKYFKEEDPRTTTLMNLAKETETFGIHCALAYETGMILNEISSKPLPMNVDGAIGAILLDMGFDAQAGNAVFLIGRVPGLLAHIIEEREQGNGIRRGK